MDEGRLVTNYPRCGNLGDGAACPFWNDACPRCLVNQAVTVEDASGNIITASQPAVFLPGKDDPVCAPMGEVLRLRSELDAFSVMRGW